MDKEQVIEIVKKYSQVIISQFAVYKVILFGSYAKDSYNENSDIDVAVILKKLPDNLLHSEFLLNKLRRNIDLRIEPIIFEDGNDPSGILEEIYETGIIVYQAA